MDYVPSEDEGDDEDKDYHYKYDASIKMALNIVTYEKTKKIIVQKLGKIK